MTKPKVSVVIPAYNHEAYVGATLRSIAEQDYPNIQIVIVDDCSVDGTVREIERFMAECSSVDVVFLRHGVNRGVTATLNTGLGAADGTYVAILASDDLFLPDRLSRQVGFMEANPEARILFANGWREKPDGSRDPLHGEAVRSLLSGSPREILRYLYTHKNPIFVQTALVRADLVSEIGGFDEDVLADDWQFHTKVFEVLTGEGQFAFLDLPVVVYRLHDQNVHRDFGRQSRLKLQFVRRYTPRNLRREAYININAELARAALSENRRTLACYHASKALLNGPRKSEFALILRILKKLIYDLPAGLKQQRHCDDAKSRQKSS